MSSQYDRGRYELKYVLPEAWRRDVVRLVEPRLRSDPHSVELPGGRRGYRVHSLYLDTPGLTDYFERLEGKRVRNRLRVRTYGEPGNGEPVFLETKRKSGPWVVKHRALVGDADSWRVCRAPRPWTRLAGTGAAREGYAASAFLQLVDGCGRSPVSLVHYEREVFVPRNPDARRVRLTLDCAATAAAASSPHDLFARAEVDLIPPGWMIMELKFESFAPAWMWDLRHELGVVAVPVSKFGLSVAQGLRAAHQEELAALMPPLLFESRRAA